MTARREDNAVRGVVFALLPALGAWVLLAVVLWLVATLLPASVLFAIAACLVVGPLLVWVFRRD